MARRNRGGSPAVSLFPFLSILACVIGVLTWLITALALSQLDPAEVQRVEAELRQQKQRAEQHQRLAAEQSQKEAELTEVQQRLAALEAEEQRLADLRDKATQLEKQRDERVDENSEAAKMVADAKQLAEAVKEAKAQRAAMQKRVEQAKKELANRNAPPEPAKVVVRPSGSGRNLQPTFVECEAKGIVIHQDDKAVQVPRGRIRTDPTYLQLLNRIADAERETIVFLLRKEGVSNYYLARRVALENYARNGKLPVTADGEIDLSLFME